ncbi:hypothetical protein SCHIN_v1c11390 [Spiroplasma chinense]|uniref:Phosphatidic acid phosphatase type 2/haloperoxidase domain-containing protein n=1 Tax=Spiroplasma chinense TaxID=216932 RepID=A0A5B9Y8I0_9MOLU|nr:phosphatase PAP2 family protein [Spiroplasma chinense]QEH62332.1 hypothetical protein SCHIN_v1c11390 [Spiroplasma chinense]
MKKKSREYTFLFLPALVVLVLTCATFIVASFYDRQIQEYFAQGFYYKWVKIWIVFMDELGLFQFLPAIFVFCAVIWESFIHYQIKFGKKDVIRDYSWIGIFYYIVAYGFFFWIVIYQGYMRVYEDTGFGQGIDAKLMETTTYRIVAYWIIKSTEFAIMLYATIYLRVLFHKRSDVLEQEYWVDSLKGLVYIGYCYTMIFVLKWGMGRPFYYSTIFNQIIENEATPRGWEYSGAVMWGTGDGTQNMPYYEWWQPNHFLDNLKEWGSVSGAKDTNTTGWWNRAFPSGHTSGTFCTITIMYLFINPQKGRVLTNKKIVIIALWFLHLNSMKFALIVYRFHWWTDLDFSTIFCIAIFPLVPKFVDKHLRWWTNLIKAKMFKKALTGFVVEKKLGFDLYTNSEKYPVKVDFFLYGKNKQEKMDKKMKHYFHVKSEPKEVIKWQEQPN